MVSYRKEESPFAGCLEVFNFRENILPAYIGKCRDGYKVLYRNKGLYAWEADTYAIQQLRNEFTIYNILECGTIVYKRGR